METATNFRLLPPVRLREGVWFQAAPRRLSPSFALLMPVQAARCEGKTVLGIVTSVNYPPKKLEAACPTSRLFTTVAHCCPVKASWGNSLHQVPPPISPWRSLLSAPSTPCPIPELWTGCAQCEPLAGSLRSFPGVWEMLEKQHRSGEHSPPGTYLASDGHPLWDAPCQASWLKKLLSQL